MAADGTYGGPSRVQSLYGLDGTDPLQDCSDGGSYVGIGTFAASLIAGRSTGVARNATIQSGVALLLCVCARLLMWACTRMLCGAYFMCVCFCVCTS